MHTTGATRHDLCPQQTAVFQTPYREPRPMLRDSPLLPIADARSEPGPLRHVVAGWMVVLVFGLAALVVSVF